MSIEYSRIILKRSTTALEVPTVPAVDDLNTFISTDIFEGELFYNIPDQKLYTRSGLTIVDLGATGGGGLPIVLGVDNTTNGNNIIVSTGDSLQDPSGNYQIFLDNSGSMLLNATSANTVRRIVFDNTSDTFGITMLDLVGTNIGQLSLNQTSMSLNFNDSNVTDGASWVKFDPTKIQIGKDSAIATDVNVIELTNTKINIFGAANNLINIDFNLLPAYADDAAAGVGGLVKGDLYQTDGTGAAPLNAVGILMVKQ